MRGEDREPGRVPGPGRQGWVRGEGPESGRIPDPGRQRPSAKPHPVMIPWPSQGWKIARRVVLVFGEWPRRLRQRTRPPTLCHTGFGPVVAVRKPPQRRPRFLSRERASRQSACRRVRDGSAGEKLQCAPSRAGLGPSVRSPVWPGGQSCGACFGRPGSLTGWPGGRPCGAGFGRPGLARSRVGLVGDGE